MDLAAAGGMDGMGVAVSNDSDILARFSDCGFESGDGDLGDKKNKTGGWLTGSNASEVFENCRGASANMKCYKNGEK